MYIIPIIIKYYLYNLNSLPFISWLWVICLNYKRGLSCLSYFAAIPSVVSCLLPKLKDVTLCVPPAYWKDTLTVNVNTVPADLDWIHSFSVSQFWQKFKIHRALIGNCLLKIRKILYKYTLSEPNIFFEII